MTSKQQESPRATVTTPADREIHVVREFAAPRDRVFAAYIEDLGDRTRVTSTSLFHTTEERDGMLASGMERGMNETFARLDEVLASLASR